MDSAPEGMDLRSFRRILLQVFLVPLAVLAITATALYFQFVNTNRAVDLIRRSDARLAQFHLLSKLFVDQETGLRGYQATGDVRFLEPYQAATPRIDSTLRTLSASRGAISPEGTPYHGIAELQEAYGAWLSAYALPLRTSLSSSAYKPDPQQDMKGKLLMDRVRVELAAAIERNQQRRDERVARWQAETRTTTVAMFALLLGTGVVIGLFYRFRLHTVSLAYRRSLASLRKQNETVYESEQKLQTTLASIGDGVIACDVDCRVELMNRVAESMTGWTEAEARGHMINEVLPLVDERDRMPIEDPVRKVKRLDQIVTLANHALLLRRDGTEVPIADSGAPIRGRSGMLHGVVMVVRDVSVERRTQEALLAQERLASAGRLAATLAHEIHNPLDAVAGLLYLMQQGASEAETTEFLSLAQDELSRVTEISRAMLGMHREATAPIRLDLRQLLHDVLLLLRQRALKTNVAIDAVLPRDIVVEGYPAELKQVFTNLLTNALEAVGEGGEVMLQVTRGSEDGVEVVVRDNGPGISPELQERLFTPFVTTKGEHGTGLGLWISRGIVAKHGGSLTLESTTDPSGHGTTVRVHLPSNLRASALEDGRQPAMPQTPAPAGWSQPPADNQPPRRPGE